MRLNPSQARGEVTRVWPSREAPYHPETNINRNIFSLMPCVTTGELDELDDTRVNIATYRDGIVRHRLPRWQQGVLLRITMIQNARAYMNRKDKALVELVRPMDRVFKGYIIGADQPVSVDGIIHPAEEGWLALNQSDFEATTGWDQPLETVADFKHMIGRMPKEEAEAQRANFLSFGHFVVNGQTMI